MPTENIEPITAYASSTSSKESISNEPVSEKSKFEKSIEPEQTEHLSQKPDLMPDEIYHDEALRNIEVISEEVKAEIIEENALPEADYFDISKIHFLPTVVEDIVDIEKSTAPQEEDQYPKAIEGEASSEALQPEPIEDELKTLIDEIRELDFLPIVIDQPSNVEAEPAGAIEEDTAESLETIEGYTLPDLEVRFNKVAAPADIDPEETPEFHLDEASISQIDADKNVDAMSWILENNKLRNIECTYEAVPYTADAAISNHLIPEPIYYDDHETYMMSLLDDLEEMGDQREIPFLNELMAEESKSFIRDRITDIIQKFTRQASVITKTSTTGAEKIELPVFSVFADLFKNIDTESKLILLDEVIHVGDEKEIEFLDGLLENPDHRIRNKAQAILQVLIAKLAHERPEAIYSKGVSAIVSEYKNPETDSEAEQYDNLLSEMEIAPSLAPELLDINFELSEILDRKYDQRILDIQVISTEVTPNEYGGSFFNSLRNFTKLF